MAHKLTDLLPERYLNSPEVGAASGIIWVLGEVFRARALDWLAQLTIDTATWGIVHWEREYGVTPQATDTLDDRRSRVKAKMRAPQTTTRAMLANVAAAYAAGAMSTVEEFPREHRVQFQFVSSGAFPMALDAMIESLREVIPAHIAFAVAVKLLRETQADVYTVVAASRRTVYPDAEVEQWQRTAGAVQYAALTGTKNRTYTEIEVQ